MKIDRSNYEIWFIDWLDCKLDDYQAQQLRLFLASNPDLQEELGEMADLRINPPSIEYSGKRNIQKVPSDITDLQFEHLCVAYIENDLSKDELAELSNITSDDQNRRKVLELYKKLKLTPSKIKFIKKKSILRRTPLQKVVRISVAGLSVAASLAILVTSYYLMGGNREDKAANFSMLILNEGRVIHSSIPQQIEYTFPEFSKSYDGKSTVTSKPAVNKLTARSVYPKTEDNNIKVPHLESLYTEKILPVEVPHNSDIYLLYHSHIEISGLIPLSLNDQIIPEKRWAAGRFFARVFREKILKEQSTDDSPLKGYEIAEAGVSGLNKLFGWEMAFEKNNDENGELKSIYFSSKILKIQTPVNRTETSY
jgi:hypothetical protein